MKIQFKALIVAASLSMIAGTSFAANTVDLSAIADVAQTADFAARSDAITALAMMAIDAAPEENLAIINQMGETGNFAFIEQQSDVGVNVAIISQDASAVANTAMIAQTGTLNHAQINQH